MTGTNQNQARRRAPVQTNEIVPSTPKITATVVKMGGRFRTMRSSPEAGPYTPIRYARKYARPATITQQPAPTTVIAKVRGPCGCSLGAVAFACWLISVDGSAPDKELCDCFSGYEAGWGWSPDGTKIVSGLTEDLSVIDIATGE